MGHLVAAHVQVAPPKKKKKKKKKKKTQKEESLNWEELNHRQRKGVEITWGPILIFAGAGSGKTRVLTHKIAYLVKDIGLPPDNILAVTFTNKAADEMKQRVRELLNMDVSSMSVGTFHSISARILRREIQLLGYSNDFVI